VAEFVRDDPMRCDLLPPRSRGRIPKGEQARWELVGGAQNFDADESTFGVEIQIDHAIHPGWIAGVRPGRRDVTLPPR
jgi:hypothetical protein